jgi:hypothetical protein
MKCDYIYGVRQPMFRGGPDEAEIALREVRDCLGWLSRELSTVAARSARAFALLKERRRLSRIAAEIQRYGLP